jgi:hypothetical protein
MNALWGGIRVVAPGAHQARVVAGGLSEFDTRPVAPAHQVAAHLRIEDDRAHSSRMDECVTCPALLQQASRPPCANARLGDRLPGNRPSSRLPVIPLRVVRTARTSALWRRHRIQ